MPVKWALFVPYSAVGVRLLAKRNPSVYHLCVTPIGTPYELGGTMTNKENLTRTRLERIILLDQELRANHYPNCSSFAKKLAERFGYEKPVNRRTILRDIDWLRDICRAPLKWSDKIGRAHV